MKSLSHLTLLSLVLVLLSSPLFAGEKPIKDRLPWLRPGTMRTAGGQRSQAKFKLEYKAKGPHDEIREIKVSHPPGKAVFSVTDQFGIGSGVIKLAEGTWPKQVLVRLHLTGLEGFDLTIGNKVVPRSELTVRMLDTRGKPVAGRYLLKSTGPNSSKRIKGYFQAEVPSALLSEDVKEIKLSWVDFYRR